jgi:hypothetical protein
MSSVTLAVPSAEPSSTPLLDALKAAKESSTIKGYHSHYRDQTNQPRTRAQQLDDEQTYNRKAPLFPRTQPDQVLPLNSAEPVAKDMEKGKEKEKEGGGGGKKKNKQKAAAVASPGPGPGPSQPKPPPPHIPKQAAQPHPPTSPSSSRPSVAEPPRARPVVGLNTRGGLLAALGAATEARTVTASRKGGGGRQRQVSGGAPNSETATVQTPGTPLPAGVLAIPPSAMPTPASTSEAGPTPGKNRRGGKNRGRGAGGGGGGDLSAPTEMARIDDPGQSLPPVPSSQRGRGSGRGRSGRGRGRGRGGAPAATDQPSAPAG